MFCVVIGSDVTVNALRLQDYDLYVCIFVGPRFVMVYAFSSLQ